MRHLNSKQLIKDFEGVRLNAYLPTPNDVPTIGYGHTRGVKLGDVITMAQADAWFDEEVKIYQEAVERNVKVPLNDNQYGALVSFTYNLGEGNLKSSTLLRVLNAGDYQEAANQLLRWDKQAGKTLRGLTRRREAERNLFLTPPTSEEPKALTVAQIIKDLIEKWSQRKGK